MTTTCCTAVPHTHIEFCKQFLLDNLLISLPSPWTLYGIQKAITNNFKFSVINNFKFSLMTRIDVGTPLELSYTQKPGQGYTRSNSPTQEEIIEIVTARCERLVKSRQLWWR